MKKRITGILTAVVLSYIVTSANTSSCKIGDCSAEWKAKAAFCMNCVSESETESGLLEGLDSLSSPEQEAIPSSYQIDGFDMIMQMPELPTGCEITAMAMVLHHYGLAVDKVELATEYLPTAAANLYSGADGRLYGPDLNRYFVGDPTTRGGYICGPEAIVTAANAYLADQGSSLYAVD